MNAAVAVLGLDKSFGSFKAVENVNFEAAEGKITALLGPSGSGKSTVLRLIAGLERPDRGRILLQDQEHSLTSVQERGVGFVFQHYALFRHMTVRANVAFGLAVRKESKAAQKKRVDELLELVQLSQFADRYPTQLSGGQRQRVALARALAPRPQVLLLDEPFGALDARVRQDLRRWLEELHKELGVTSLLVTHDQEEALELAHRVVVMHEGRVEQVGTPSEIYNEPETPFVANFVGSANVIHGLVIGGRVQFGEYLIEGAKHLSDGLLAHAYVRPHNVRVVRMAPVDGLSSPAQVERIVDLGWGCRVYLRLPDGQVVVAQVACEEVSGMAPGSSVYVDLKKAKVFSPEGTEVKGPDELAAM
jgi:sulfate/thiosulfate transport system ATP-binding protein